MCVVSMVHDHFGPKFDWWKPNEIGPTPDPLAPLDPEKAAELVKKYWAALEAAKKVDELTAQPDCVDPEKAKLEDRVKKLEEELEKLKAGKRKKRSRKK